MSSTTSRSTGEEYRRRLYEAREADDGLREFAARALSIGVDYLGVDDAQFNRLREADDGRVHDVLVAGDGDLIAEGDRYDHDTSYCRRAVEREASLAVADAADEGWVDDPAYREHGLACYLGATVRVDGERFGTVCFLGRGSRDRSFTPDERSFVELIARSIGRRLETERHERRMADSRRARSRSNRKYEALLTAAPDAVVLVDADTGTVAEVNDAATALLDAPADDVLGRPAVDYFPAADRARLRDLLPDATDERVAARSRYPDGTPVEVRTADGEAVPVEVSAARVDLDGDGYVQAILRDVSERRERQRELRLKDRAVEEAAVGISIAELDGSDAPLRYVNREFERLTGYDREAVLDRDCRVLQGEATEGDPVAALGEAIGRREPHTTELLNYRADGTPFWNEVTVAPVEHDGEVTHYVGFQRDVTGRKRRERQVSVLNRVLRHNVRNRTNVIRGFADILAERLSADGDGDGNGSRTDPEAAPGGGADASPSSADLAGRVADAADDLANLSEMARRVEGVVREPGEPTERDAAAAVREVAADLRERHAGDDVRIRVDAPVEAPALATPHLRTALTELAENALRYGDGSATVRVRRAADGAGDDEAVTITVADDGPGLPADERTLVEEGRETPVEHGEGLGLWLVNRVVTDAGGRVSVAVDDGTTVTVRLQGPDGGAPGLGPAPGADEDEDGDGDASTGA